MKAKNKKVLKKRNGTKLVRCKCCTFFAALKFFALIVFFGKGVHAKRER
jgi:hypothetical protein